MVLSHFINSRAVAFPLMSKSSLVYIHLLGGLVYTIIQLLALLLKSIHFDMVPPQQRTQFIMELSILLIYFTLNIIEIKIHGLFTNIISFQRYLVRNICRLFSLSRRLMYYMVRGSNSVLTLNSSHIYWVFSGRSPCNNYISLFSSLEASYTFPKRDYCSPQSSLISYNRWLERIVSN